jgi:DNA-binding XRE family transcriptional regulator
MDSPEVVGNRLYKIRFVAGFGAAKPPDGQQKAFALKAGFDPKSYNQWETGKIRVPVKAAIVICKWAGNGVTLEYIYRGRLDSMGPGWTLPLKEAPDRPGFVRHD